VSTEKSKDLRNQLDGLGLAVEFAQNALNRSESALEDKEKDLHDAHSALLLKEVIGSTLKKQAGIAPYRYNGALCCTATIPHYAVLSCTALYCTELCHAAILILVLIKMLIKCQFAMT
jgi:hypothetical protein